MVNIKIHFRSQFVSDLDIQVHQLPNKLEIVNRTLTLSSEQTRLWVLNITKDNDDADK